MMTASMQTALQQKSLPAGFRKPRTRCFSVYVHVALVIFVSGLLLTGDPTIILLLGGCAAVPVFLWIALREASNAPLWFSPISFLFIWNTIGMGASAIYMAGRAARGDWVDFSIASVPPSDLASGYVLTMLGLLALHIGLE